MLEKGFKVDFETCRLLMDFRKITDDRVYRFATSSEEKCGTPRFVLNFGVVVHTASFVNGEEIDRSDVTPSSAICHLAN